MQEYSNKIDEYINIVCQQIRFKKTHKYIGDELRAHIIDQKNDFISEGLDDETATLESVKQMGDPVIVGNQLDRTHRPKTEWSVIILTVIMLIISLSVPIIFSDDYSTGVFQNTFQKQLFSSIISMIILIIIYFVDYTIIGKYPKIIYFSLLVFYLFIYNYNNSTVINGARISIYFYSLLFVPAYVGIVYSMRDKNYLGIFLSGIIYLFPTILLVNTRFVYCIIFSLCCLVIITSAILKGWFNVKKRNALLLVYLPTIMIIAVFIIFIISRRGYRLEALLFPERDPYASGYQAMLVRDIVKNSQFMGPVESSEFFGQYVGDIHSIGTNIPAWQSDFVITYLNSKLGFLCGIVITLIFTTLIARMFILSFKQKNYLGFMISFSGTFVITLQGILYILSNFGVTLFTASILPFFSYSGHGLIANMCILGFILSVFRNENLIKRV